MFKSIKRLMGIKSTEELKAEKEKYEKLNELLDQKENMLEEEHYHKVLVRWTERHGRVYLINSLYPIVDNRLPEDIKDFKAYWAEKVKHYHLFGSLPRSITGAMVEVSPTLHAELEMDGTRLVDKNGFTKFWLDLVDADLQYQHELLPKALNFTWEKPVEPTKNAERVVLTKLKGRNENGVYAYHIKNRYGMEGFNQKVSVFKLDQLLEFEDIYIDVLALTDGEYETMYYDVLLKQVVSIGHTNPERALIVVQEELAQQVKDYDKHGFDVKLHIEHDQIVISDITQMADVAYAERVAEFKQAFGKYFKEFEEQADVE